MKILWKFLDGIYLGVVLWATFALLVEGQQQHQLWWALGVGIGIGERYARWIYTKEA